jgi:hypothetical protein
MWTDPSTAPSGETGVTRFSTVFRGQVHRAVDKEATRVRPNRLISQEPHAVWGPPVDNQVDGPVDKGSVGPAAYGSVLRHG